MFTILKIQTMQKIQLRHPNFRYVLHHNFEFHSKKSKNYAMQTAFHALPEYSDLKNILQMKSAKIQK